MRDDGRESCLRVLGLQAGASAQEIKAAYRDLAKVWHPDRFAHDPRLQQKAQEQLKEINEAYQRLVNGDFTAPRPRANPTHQPREARDTQAPPRASTASTADDDPRETHAATTTADERVAVARRRGVSRVAIAAPAIVFCATFAVVTPRLLSSRRAPGRAADSSAVSTTARDGQGAASNLPPGANADDAAATGARAGQKSPAAAEQQGQTSGRQQLTPSAESARAVAAEPLRAMPTVTVAIDPTTGLRARAGCPAKSAMTFPAGDEPSAYCDAHHAPAPPRATADDTRANKADDARGKSFAGRLSSSAKKLFGGSRPSDKEPARDKND